VPIVLLTTQENAVIAGCAARLGVSVLWQPVSPERLQQTVRGLVPRELCLVC
jgi:hypothetical protein